MNKVMNEIKAREIASLEELLEDPRILKNAANSSSLTKGRRGKTIPMVVKEMQKNFKDPRSYEYKRLSEGLMILYFC
jgi:hypothetical protein